MLRRPGNIPNKVLIAAATLSLTAVTAGISPAASAAGRPPAPSASVAATHVSPRAAVPWRRVGPGWVLAQYWPGRFADPGQAKAAPVTLYLISPAGHRYLLRRWAATKKPVGLTDWSGDKTRVLLFNQLSGRLEQLTLATGRVSPISLPRQVSFFTTSYTRPAGQGLLAFRPVRGGSQLVRLSLTGRLVKVLASGPHDGTAVYSTSGATIAVAGAKGLQLVSTNGGVIRRLPVPRTGSSGCFPARWWNSRTILASCVARGAHRDRLWLVPASGARPRPLTPQHGPHSPDPGDFNAWATPGGLYLQAVTSSGNVLIFRQRANGTLRAVKVPGSARINWIASTRGSRLLVNQESPCASTDSLLWFNPATGREQSLIKAPRGRAGLLGFVPYGPPEADIIISVICPAARATRELSSPGLSSPGAVEVAPGLPRT
jgi:TolB protein